jgi:hypothetical protein
MAGVIDEKVPVDNKLHMRRRDEIRSDISRDSWRQSVVWL